MALVPGEVCAAAGATCAPRRAAASMATAADGGLAMHVRFIGRSPGFVFMWLDDLVTVSRARGGASIHFEFVERYRERWCEGRHQRPIGWNLLTVRIPSRLPVHPRHERYSIDHTSIASADSPS